MDKNVYDHIAKDFANTRIHTWKWTDNFIQSIPRGSIILDIGSGNGRNLSYKDMIMFGIDISIEQLKMGNNSIKNLIQGDMISIPFKNHMFDYIISIASFHHLKTLEERKLCLAEMKRILTPNGKILLSVWSINQPKKTKRTFSRYGDTIVYWKHIPRYYYIFNIQEITKLLQEYFTIENHIWDCGNEIFILTK